MARALDKTVALRMTNDEVELLDALAKRYYPETSRSRSLMVRRLIRAQAAREQKRQEQTEAQRVAASMEEQEWIRRKEREV